MLILSDKQSDQLRDMIVEIGERAYAEGFNHGAFVVATTTTGDMTPEYAREVIARRAEKLAEIVSEVGFKLFGEQAA